MLVLNRKIGAMFFVSYFKKLVIKIYSNIVVFRTENYKYTNIKNVYSELHSINFFKALKC